MRTQTLLLTAVLSVAGAATSMAQVYSVNAVGYVNTTLHAGKFNLISNPLDAGAGNNIVSKILAGIPDGSVVYKYVSGKYLTPDGFDASLGWDDPNLVVNPGEGIFVLVAGKTDPTITFVGEVKQGALSNPLDKGFSMRSSQVPQAGKLVADLKFPAVDGMVIYQYQNGKYVTSSYDAALGWDPADPTIAVGEAFWALLGAATTWDRQFSVNAQ